MPAIFYFSAYIILPILISWLYKKSGPKKKVWLTHLFSLVLVFICPTILVVVVHWINPAQPEKLNSQIPWYGAILLNAFVLLPLSQTILFLCNRHFKNYSPVK
jgi:hypothetical protein